MVTPITYRKRKVNADIAVFDNVPRLFYSRGTMKTPHTHFVSVRVTKEMFEAFKAKTISERDQDMSSVLRQLIQTYLLKGLKNVH